MKCKKIKEIILSDYIDDELDLECRKNVEIHLEKCESCRQFKDDVDLNIVGILQHASKLEPRQELWYKIKDKLEPKRRLFVPENITGFLKGLFTVRKPIYAVAAIMMLVVVTGVFSKLYMNEKNSLDRYLGEQMAFVLSLDNGSEDENDDIGIPFEIFSI